MSLARWEERLAPLDGIAAVVFWVAGVAVLQGPADQPDMDASPARALVFFKTEEDAILLGTFLFMVGTLFLLWFLGLVRTRLVAAEGGSHRLSSIAFAAGVATAVSLLVMPAVHATGAINNDNLSPDSAQVYLGINVVFFYAAELSAAVFLLALGLVSLAAQAFPGWLAWASLVLTVWLLIPPIGWAGLLWGFPLWLVAVSLILATRSRNDSRPGREHRTP
jgi:hypothetical protein